MFIVFDTETTGLPRNYNAPLSDSENWPRIVQIAWQLHDNTGKLIRSKDHVVFPDGFSIPFNAAKIHGISTEIAIGLGISLKDALTDFINDLNEAQYLCGHNLEFDLNIIGAEFYRLGIGNLFEGKKVLDTMQSSVDFCAIPGGKGGKFKYPKLEELHEKLFNKSFAEAHNACADVEATGRCFFELCRLGIIKAEGSTITTETLSDLNEVAPLILATVNRISDYQKELESKATEPKNISNVKQVITADFKFTHLHNHSQFSVLQSTTEIDDLVKRAGKFGCPAVALTDHGNLYAAFQFWNSINKYNKDVKGFNEKVEKGEAEGPLKVNIKCIIGSELNVTNNRLDKNSQNNGFNQVFLAKNQTGYQNLIKLCSIGFIEGYYYVPRVDKESILKYKEGLIATTGGLNGEIPNLILNIGEEQAEQAFAWWKEQFGDDFYVELNRHNLEDENHVNQVLLRFAKKYDVKYFAANNNYYLDKENAKAHDVLLCVKDGELQETPIGKGRGFRFGFPNDEFYFKSPQEMLQSFQDLPEALECTNEIVDKIQPFSLGRDVLLPEFKLPLGFIESKKEEIEASFVRICGYKKGEWEKKNLSEEQTEKEKAVALKVAQQHIYLVDLTYKGAAKRYPDMPESTKERIDFELATIEKMGYPGYFLIVQDFTTYARDNGVSVGPGRGSAAGSAIAYCLGITNVDPIKYDLLFERFLNPDRVSMPDIDIDFDDEGREKVIKYVIEKYGEQQVAQIITYGTMGGKSALRDTARVLNLPLPEADRLAKSFPDSPDAELKKLFTPTGIADKLKEKLKERSELIQKAEEFVKMAQAEDLQAQTIKQATQLEGSVRNTGIHACGIIITPDELTKFVPVQKAKDADFLVTQFDNSVAESAGLLKMDFLGLRTLTIIKDAIKLIKKTRNIDIDIDAIPLDDPITFQLFQKGQTKGIFQFESPGMQKYLRELKPDKFEELIAMNALYRPGPLAYIPNFIKRKHGQEPITYDLADMEEYLKDTYGITVYQEQVMLLSQKLAGFSKGDADVLRKAMGKKQKDVLDKMKSQFMKGCEERGHDLKVCDKVWTDWEAFASYAFNKSHSTCYAYIAYQTAYLKANYTSEFIAANLTHQMSTTDQVAFYLDECKELNIPVLGPDINESEYKFSVNQHGHIRVGMGAIKGVGENAVLAMIEEREKNGPYKSIFDVTKRISLRTVNKKVLENLAYVGGFDQFKETHRGQYFHIEQGNSLNTIEQAIKYGASFQDGQNSSQVSLFGEGSEVDLPEPKLPKCEPWHNLEKLKKEKDFLGIYISGHPLDDYKFDIENFCNIKISDLKELEKLKGKELRFGGMVTLFNHRVAKNGNPFGSIKIEDYESDIELMLFGNDYLSFRNFMIEGLFVYIKGKVDKKRYNDELEFKITQIQLLSEVRSKNCNNINLSIALENLTEKLIDDLLDLINKNQGTSNVKITVFDRVENTSLELPSKRLKINPTNELFKGLKEIGVENFKLN